MKFLRNLLGSVHSSTKRKIISKSCIPVESLEERLVLTASPLPVLMVIADQHDFYYKEYGDTRQSLEGDGVSVQVAATTLATSYPHSGTGEPWQTGGAVTPDLTLAEVNPEDYSAIVFVGGWGASMYQYAFTGDYQNNLYDGDPATKQIVNDLISEFVAQDKYVSGICHGVTVLAWARVDGASPLNGKQVSVPYIGSPAVVYGGYEYGNYGLGQYEQVVANGAIANTSSGQYGQAWTATDDVVVDGRIITAENYDSALQFGHVIAQQVIAAAASETPPPENHAPVATDAIWQLVENSAAGSVVGIVSASDPDAGQSLSYEITAGNTNNAFAIDPVTGQITVNNSAAINFEAITEFQLSVQVTDNGTSELSGTAQITIQIQNVVESAIPGVLKVSNDLVVQGTSADDLLYLWSGARDAEIYVWMNGVFYGGYQMDGQGQVVVHGGDGNDQIFATDSRYPVAIFGERGHDLITGGSANDLLDGGSGWDRVWGSAGDDQIRGGDGNDFLFGREGNDVIIGGDGDDYLDGDIGRDFLIGGAGQDYMKGGADEDLLIGGVTTFDSDASKTAQIQSIWLGSGTVSNRQAALQSSSPYNLRLAWNETLCDDAAADIICSGESQDLVFANLGDGLYLQTDDLLSVR